MDFFQSGRPLARAGAAPAEGPRGRTRKKQWNCAGFQIHRNSSPCRVTFVCDASCGGIADRVKGLSGAMIRAVAQGCHFQVSISHPVDFYPHILKPSSYAFAVDPSWNAEISNTSLSLRIFGDYHQSWSFCSWLNYSTVNVRSNVPGPIEACESSLDITDSWLHKCRGPSVGGLYE